METARCRSLQQCDRVIGIDRRGHGRSSQGADGHDIDHERRDAAAVIDDLELRGAVDIGHETAGGEVTRDVGGAMARAGSRQGRPTSAAPPTTAKTPSNSAGPPIEVLDGLSKPLAADRRRVSIRDLLAGSFHGFNWLGAAAEPGRRDPRLAGRQGTTGGFKAHDDGIKAPSETGNFTEDLNPIDVPDASAARTATTTRSCRTPRTSRLLAFQLLEPFDAEKIYRAPRDGMLTTPTPDGDQRGPVRLHQGRAMCRCADPAPPVGCSRH